MTVREGFGLAVRIGGAWKLLESFCDLYFIIVKSTGLPTGSTLPIQFDIDAFIYRFLIGLCLIITADFIVKLVYGQNAKPAE